MLRDFNTPDVKAPRYRASAMTLLNKSFYNQVRNHNKELSHLSDKEIKHIIKTGCQIIQDKVIESRDGIELPALLGYLFIGSTAATKQRNVDYKKSLELGKLVHHKNWDTDNLTGKIFYTTFGTRYRFKFHELWKFTPVRQFKKLVSQNYIPNYTKYVRIDNWLKVSNLFRKNMLADKSKPVRLY